MNRKTLTELTNLCLIYNDNNEILVEEKITKYGKKVDLKEFAIHHRFDGLVGLVPRELHESIHHYGYFYRLGH